ncbi:MAG: hypothetical protein KN64_02180 [Sulfurovum sp. AS07-7]|nr:MAG: hypothetical protein KN64_02180 [Sulfurovum sp. AS07-7]
MLKIKVLPANCGDCIIVNFDDGDGIIKNILIDGGANTVYDNILKDEISEINYLFSTLFLWYNIQSINGG